MIRTIGMNHMKFSVKSFDELTLHELYAMLRLRQEIFIVEQTCYYLDADGQDQDSYHIYGVDGEGNWQAYARIMPPGLSYRSYGSIGRVLTSASSRGTGVGKLLMEYSIAYYREQIGNTPIKISAQSYLLTFYTSFGFEAIGDEYLEDGIPHKGMVLVF